MTRLLYRAFTIFLKSAMLAWAIVITVAAILTYGPYWQGMLSPVLENTVVHSVKRDADSVEWQVSTDKVLPCRITDIDFTVQVGSRITALLVYNDRNELVGPTASYKVGHLDLGPWHTKIPPSFEDATSIESSAYYDCPPHWWLTHEDLGVVTIPSFSTLQIPAN